MLESLKAFFSSEDFMPHGHCFLWYPEILWLHVISDAVIAISYFAIPLSLLYFTRHQHDLPFRFLFRLFGAFITLCGTTHLLGIWVIWHSDYALEGIVKAWTAVVSLVTAIIAWKIMPLALMLKSPKELADMNARLQAAYDATERQVEERTAELRELSQKLQYEIEGKEAINLRLQEALSAAESANTAKSEFLANMSHEIRTPMNAVIGLANILAMSEPLTPRQREFIGTLQTSADALLALINDLLDIAKIEAQTVELESVPVNLAQIALEASSILAVKVREKNLSFNLQTSDMEGRLYKGDPTRLRQIIMNLCSNAVKFTEKGGVDISLSHTASQQPGFDTVRISVRDTGIGIAPDKLENIFQKFMQADNSINRKYGGTGLGLAITKTLVEYMGGQVTVQSTPGQGSEFTLTLDMEYAGPASGATPGGDNASIPALGAASGPRLLLVEDYQPNVLVAMTFLENFGYSVDVAGNGKEAFDKVQNQAYHAVLMDVQMPGMSGFEATKLIRGWEKETGRKHLPIIGMTAHALAGDREQCLASGMDDYIAKPFKPEDLQQKLDFVLRKFA